MLLLCVDCGSSQNLIAGRCDNRAACIARREGAIMDNRDWVKVKRDDQRIFWSRRFGLAGGGEVEGQVEFCHDFPGVTFKPVFAGECLGDFSSWFTALSVLEDRIAEYGARGR